MSEENEAVKIKPKGPTCTIPEAGAYYFDLKPAGSYMAAAAGIIPTMFVGKRRKRALVFALDRLVAR